MEPLVLLVSLLLAAVVGLAPGEGTRALGWERLVLGAITWAWVAVLLARTRPAAGTDCGEGRSAGTLFAVRATVMQVATLPSIFAGITLIAGTGGGLAWAVVGAIGGYIAVLFDAWVLLIEIKR